MSDSSFRIVHIYQLVRNEKWTKPLRI